MIIKKEYKNALLIGIIASLIVIYFIQPGLNSLGNVVFEISSRLFKNFNDQLYQRIATRTINIDFRIHFFSFMTILIIMSLIMAYNIIIRSNTISELNEFEQTVNKKLDKGEINNDIPVSDVKEDLNILYNKKLKIKKNMIIEIIFYILFFLFLVIYFFVNQSIEISIRNKINVYENTIKIAAPYITEDEAKIFESNFVLIKNENDYNSLIKEINNILNKNGKEILWEKY